MTRAVITAAVLFVTALAACQQDAATSTLEEEITVYEGVPKIHDGDNVKIHGVNIRLLGIDACELGQPARVGDTRIDCGIWARDRFRNLIGSHSIRCESAERDVYDRPLAICYSGRIEINRTLVETGIVFAYGRNSDYENEQDKARRAGEGIWGFQEVERPRNYRRQN